MNDQPKSLASIPDTLSRVRSLALRTTRDAENCFWIEGIRQFVQAFDARMRYDTVIQSPILLKSPLAEMIVRRLKAQGVRRVKVSPEQFRTISTTERASGIGAIVKQQWFPLAHAEPGRGLCWVVLEEIRSPGNLGSIVRTAEAAGASGIIFVGPRCDPFDPAVVRASMGSLSHLPLVRTTHHELARWATTHDVMLTGLSPEAERLWTELPAAKSVGVVLGEERGGLSTPLRRLCHTMVRLPMTGNADSLNVSVAAGVMMYELVRRSQIHQISERPA